MKRTILVLITILLLCAGANAYAQSIEYVGSTLWGGINDIKVVGQYAYCACTNGLMILNVSDSNSIRIIGKLYIPGEQPILDISGNHIFYCNNRLGLNIINISNLEFPQLIGQYRNFADANDIAILDSLAYIISTARGLRILNISNLNNPYIFFTLPLNGTPTDINIKGAYAFIPAAFEGGLIIVDISNPSLPQIVTSFNDSLVQPYKISITGNIALIAGRSADFRLIDISNPIEPFYLGREFWPNYVHYVIGDGNFAFSTSEADPIGIDKFDISNPRHPVEISALPLPIVEAKGLTKANNKLYLIDGARGLRIIDIDNQQNMFLADSFLAPINVKSVCSGADIACVLNDSNMAIIDIAQSHNPTVLINLAVGDNYLGNFIYREHFECIYSRDKCTIIDINNPLNPLIISNLNLNRNILKIINKDNLFFFARDNGMSIYDYSNPAAPRFLNYTPTSTVNDICYANSHIYLAADTGIYILDSLNLAHPRFDSLFVAAEIIDCIFANNNILYAGGRYYLYLYDISNPVSPHYLSTIPARSRPGHISFQDNLACISSLNLGLSIYDISNPVFPIQLSYFNTLGIKNTVMFDNTILVADTKSLLVLRFSPTDIDGVGQMPSTFSLSPNYPNPFNSSTVIKYNLPTASDVTLDIYDILGRKVEQLLALKQNAGPQQAIWNADKYPSGLYFARLKAGEQIQNTKMMLIK